MHKEPLVVKRQKTKDLYDDGKLVTVKQRELEVENVDFGG